MEGMCSRYRLVAGLVRKPVVNFGMAVDQYLLACWNCGGAVIGIIVDCIFVMGLRFAFKLRSKGYVGMRRL